MHMNMLAYDCSGTLRFWRVRKCKYEDTHTHACMHTHVHQTVRIRMHPLRNELAALGLMGIAHVQACRHTIVQACTQTRTHTHTQAPVGVLVHLLRYEMGPLGVVGGHPAGREYLGCGAGRAAQHSLLTDWCVCGPLQVPQPLRSSAHMLSLGICAACPCAVLLCSAPWLSPSAPLLSSLENTSHSLETHRVHGSWWPAFR